MQFQECFQIKSSTNIVYDFALLHHIYLNCNLELVIVVLFIVHYEVSSQRCYTHYFNQEILFTQDCFHSLLRLLRWAWQSFKAGYCEAVLGSLMPASAALIDLERLEYICTSCLHLLKIYINEIYPKGCKYIYVYCQCFWYKMLKILYIITMGF